jgi:EmrB/QacA subfamily drug resistance transporter
MSKTTSHAATVTDGPSAASAAPGDAEAPISHRKILQTLSGLLLGLFVATVSSTIVSTALPTILADIGGGQSAYTWVVTAPLLALTATTPIWGKLSDLMSKKFLVQLALLLYIVSSVVAGLAQDAGTLIACRAVQGIGAGGLTALAQFIMAAMVPPRQRGRYSGYLGASYALATVGGPLIGGVITDVTWLGWRWCFYAVIPFALIAMAVLHRTIDLPVVRAGDRVDWLGAVLVTVFACLLMVWITLAGDQYDWLSWQSAVMVPGALVLGLLFVVAESRASAPLVPLRFFRNATITLSSLAGLFVGVAMFAGTIFMSQYFQLSKGRTPTMAGVMTIPLVGGLLVASMLSGRIITRTGKWKMSLVVGGVFLTAGALLLGTLRTGTPYWQSAFIMIVFGIGVGLLFQNLVLAVQNQVSAGDLGSASSLVSFFRSLGGALGLSALGALLGSRVAHFEATGFASSGDAPSSSGSGIPHLASLPAPVREVIEAAYGHGIGDVFLGVAPCALLALVLILFIRETPLRSSNADAPAPRTDAS